MQLIASSRGEPSYLGLVIRPRHPGSDPGSRGEERWCRVTPEQRLEISELHIQRERGPHQTTTYRYSRAASRHTLNTASINTFTPLSTGLLYPKLRAQTSGIIQKLYETKTNTNTGWFKSVYWLFSEIKPKMCDFACFHCFSSKNGLNCNMTFR